MIAAGRPVPDARVWAAPREEPIDLAGLASEGPFLLLFYLFDWSGT